MKGTNFVLVLFGVLHFLPQPCTVGSTNDSRAPPWHGSHSATRDEEESQKTSSHPNRQKTGVPLSQHGQSEGNTTARQRVKVTEHAGPVLSTVENIYREEQAFDLRLKNDDNKTAPIRSYPTGLTQSKKTMAFVNKEDGRGMLNKTMAFWNVADGRSKPKKTMAVWDQIEGRWKEDVSPSLMKTQDENGTVSRRAHQVSTKETLEKGSIKEAPENDSIKEALEKGSNIEDPENVSTKEEPEKGDTKEAPEKGLIKETLEKGSNKEDPVKGSIKEEPAKGYTKEAPEKGNIKETPRKGYIKEAQEKGFNKETHGKGFVNEAPAEGSINEAPAEGSINEAPAEGSINEAPAEGSINEAPAEGSINEAPAEGSINEAPAEGSINEAPAEGPIKETQEDHIHKDRTEKLAVLTNLKKDLGEIHTAPQLPPKRQNEGGIVLHARKGQNEHKAVSTTPMKDRFENHPVSQHTHKDEKVLGNTPDQWRQDVTGKGTTSSALQQDQEGSDAVALSLKKNQNKTEPVPHIGKTHGHRNGTAFPPFGTKHSGIATNKATNETDTKQNPRTERENESSSAALPPREKERTVVLEEGGNKMEAEKMLVDSKAKPHKRAVYSLALHRSERQVNNDENCSCSLCDINEKFDGDFENIAYNKEVQMSTTFSSLRAACFLVNGLTTTTDYTTCILTDIGDLKAWVEIDLGEVYSFEKLVVFRRCYRCGTNGTKDFDTQTLWGLQTIVDGDICYTWPAYNDMSVLPAYNLTDRYNITCGHVVTGRYFRVRKRELPGAANLSYIISLCEVYVMVCKIGYFGRNSCNMCPPDRSCKYVCNNVLGCDTLVPFNVAMKKTASMSSTLYGDASFLVDGVLGDSDPHRCTATNPFFDGSSGRWWQVDTGESYRIFKLHVHNRVDINGRDLKHFDVFVENEGMDTLSMPTKKCAEHRNETLENGAEVVLTCDPSQLNEGRFVILVAPRPYTLQLCEVRVMGHKVKEYASGENCSVRNEIKRCKLTDICANDICKINLGGSCRKWTTGCTIGTVCDSDTCKLDIDESCTGNENLCRFGSACDTVQAKCKWELRQPCSGNTCVNGTECDVLNTCKRHIGGECDDTLDCLAGAQCQLNRGSNKCICSGASTSCDTSTGYAGGSCTASGDCLAPKLNCTASVCNCEAGYTVFAQNFSCKVAVNFPCGTTPDCNTGMECINTTCKLVTGKRCKQGADECMPAQVCDVGDICRLEVNGNCSNYPLLCRSGAMCEAGACKLRATEVCTVAGGTECAAGTICTESKHDNATVKRCRLNPGQPCSGTDIAPCEENSLCDNNMCRLNLESVCVGANTAFCSSGTICDSSKCKYDLGHECAITSQCISTAVCDARMQTCRLRKGESCFRGRYQCRSGATCLPGSGGGTVCQCTVNPNVDQASADCEPMANAVGGSCTNMSCSDPYAICQNAICECINGTTSESSNYTCGYGPGKDCRNNNNGCNSGTFCDRSGLCQLLLGQSCEGRMIGMCSTGLVCDEGICKLFLNRNCRDNPDLCMAGTVCGINKKCKLPQGSNCGDDSVCVGGARCQDYNCTCNDTISPANGSICEPLAGKVNGKCSGGTSCEDQHANCNTTTNLCTCQQGYTTEPTTLSCRLAKGESCEGEPSSCTTGTTCDPTTKTCRLKLGQICEKDMDCRTEAICNEDGTCKIALNGSCTTGNSDCKTGTFCDQLNKCRYGKAHKCNNTEQCAAGAVCLSSYCVCSREISITYGAICAPNSGRIGSDCGEVIACDASLGGTCGSTDKCECPADTAVVHDFSCEGFVGKKDDGVSSNTSAKGDIALILGTVAGVVALLACMCCVYCIFRRRERREQTTEVAERDANLAALKALSMAAPLDGTTEMPQPSGGEVNVGEEGVKDTAPQQPVDQDDNKSIDSIASADSAASAASADSAVQDTAPQQPVDQDNDNKSIDSIASTESQNDAVQD
ncbi:uncharacterized protein [Littorina saxatilis]|uniref:uncharacterized protein isoform X2 n=1 Tax=Littorina saxatilis TaxID=31220 RepID=UPI0038B421F2